MNELVRQKLKFALIFNFLILALEIVGLILSIQRHGIMVFVFYTEDSNYFALAVSLIFCIGGIIALKKQTALPGWIHSLRFIATVCLTITFIVANFVIIPLQPQLLTYMLFEGSSLYQHLLCPILSVISFLVLENQIHLPRKMIFYATIPTIVYGITLITLNLTKVITGPYPFFYFFQIPWFVSVLSILGIGVIAVLSALVLYFLNNKRYHAFVEVFKTQT